MGTAVEAADFLSATIGSIDSSTEKASEGTNKTVIGRRASSRLDSGEP